MARTDNLSNFLTDVANAIREKKETSSQIPAKDFDTQIKSIEKGFQLVDWELGDEDIYEEYGHYVKKGQFVTNSHKSLVEEGLTIISSNQNSCSYVDMCPISSSIFLVTYRGAGDCLYAATITISGTNVTVNATKQLSSYAGSYQWAKPIRLYGQFFLVTYSRGGYLYGIIVRCVGSTFYALGTETRLSANSGSAIGAKAICVDRNRAFITHATGNNTGYINYTLITQNELSITVDKTGTIYSNSGAVLETLDTIQINGGKLYTLYELSDYLRSTGSDIALHQNERYNMTFNGLVNNSINKQVGYNQSIVLQYNEQYAIVETAYCLNDYIILAKTIIYEDGTTNFDAGSYAMSFHTGGGYYTNVGIVKLNANRVFCVGRNNNGKIQCRLCEIGATSLSNAILLDLNTNSATGLKVVGANIGSASYLNYVGFVARGYGSSNQLAVSFIREQSEGTAQYAGGFDELYGIAKTDGGPGDTIEVYYPYYE